jgi:hypothetical protein
MCTSLYYEYGNSRAKRFASESETYAAFLNERLRFGLFDSKRWLFHPFARFSLPVAVTLKRFFAPLLVFSLGICLPLFAY